MLFNSFVFIKFFIIFFVLYFLLRKNYKIQNILILVSSYIFYGYWDWRFLFLIFISTIVDYFVGLKLAGESVKKRRKLLLLISVATNLIILGFFKYFNFFSESFVNLFQLIGFNVDSVTLNIILPIGISFYTFQTMSYTIDIFREKLKPTRNFIDFAVFVAFFPQLVAGPIERAINLLPQVQRKRIFSTEQINAGIFLILWGYFKKVVIADNAAIIVESVFNNYTEYQGLDLLVGVLAFTIQIYGDFSGYSDIARGLSKLLGFELMVNFKLPYFALNPSDFWNRWHISLSSWLRDYLYFSFGGNRKGKFKTYRNLFLTMLLGGLWHGAAWNFVIWGLFHGLILIIYRIIGGSGVKNETTGSGNSYLKSSFQMLLMFILTIFGWLLFRAESYDQIAYFICNFDFGFSSETTSMLTNLLFFVLPLILIQVWQHRNGDLLIVTKKPLYVIIPIYSFLLIWIFIFGVRESSEFIYFQF